MLEQMDRKVIITIHSGKILTEEGKQQLLAECRKLYDGAAKAHYKETKNVADAGSGGQPHSLA